MEPTPAPAPSTDRDGEHLRLLAIFHYVLAAIGAVFACFPLLHVGLGLMMVLNPDFLAEGPKANPPPWWFGYIFVVLGGLMVLAGWAMAIATFISGRFMARRRHRMFSFVVAAILCIFMPFGTVLGIFTIIVLSKESVQRLYLDQAGGRTF